MNIFDDWNIIRDSFVINCFYTTMNNVRPNEPRCCQILIWFVVNDFYSKKPTALDSKCCFKTFELMEARY